MTRPTALEGETQTWEILSKSLDRLQPELLALEYCDTDSADTHTTAAKEHEHGIAPTPDSEHPPSLLYNSVESSMSDEAAVLRTPSAPHSPELQPQMPLQAEEQLDPSSPMPRSVRFRSRVRITSGIPRVNKHHHHSYSAHHLDINNDDEIFERAASSRSSSPSSSISAPLRTRDDELASPWGPFGQRVRIFAGGRRRQQAERTPLLISKQPLYLQHEENENEMYTDYIDAERARWEQELDAAFGSWPGRLLNRHWWWWRMEPVLCCICIELDESDTEEDY
ncbi:hypothetical protein CYLTODRAFT_426272 [Cylindrobasidium torrendii FP15055 ss-10]|uniref:Uncharacterized protein n=1 Tax=Cylindrobasidium torrendii FP15055 ss-10 TaxID=1314674 RepID=A0A0D7AY21_9AGAR|nr:hypothetical protein CYLTODRAFT_426272 [Cylindrobasidium torrendii FP15055 ss-10]